MFVKGEYIKEAENYKRTIVVLLGHPGSGKGTFAEALR